MSRDVVKATEAAGSAADVFVRPSDLADEIRLLRLGIPVVLDLFYVDWLDSLSLAS